LDHCGGHAPCKPATVACRLRFAFRG